jgi:hypothetical protein
MIPLFVRSVPANSIEDRVKYGISTFAGKVYPHNMADVRLCPVRHIFLRDSYRGSIPVAGAHVEGDTFPKLSPGIMLSPGRRGMEDGIATPDRVLL